MTDTGEALSDAEDLKKAVRAARGKSDEQQIIYINRQADSGKRLNGIILGIASFMAGALLSLIIWQLNRLTDKVDDVNGRVIRLETTIGAKP